MIVVTGGAGFIGSALVNGLNQKGINNIWVVDQVDHPEKQNNLNPLIFDQLIGQDNFLNKILEKKNNSEFEILHWDVININPIEIIEKIICSQTLNNKKPCKAKAKFYTKNKSYYCSRHSKKLIPNLFL